VPYKLLLADDSVTIQRVIELTFADEDIQVVAVSDGDQAIARLEADPPDIVLADVGMPGRDGYEVAAYVKNSPRLAHIPVVLLTGAFEPVDQVRADSAGCDGVLAKPFEPQLVIGRVRELLGQAGRAPVTLDANLAPPDAAPEPWTMPLDPPIPAAASAAPKASGDDYFDRLDAAFATLSNTPATASKPAAAANPIADSIDWFTTKPGAPPPPDLPLSYASPQADFDRSAAAASSRAMPRDERPPAPPVPRMEPVHPQARSAAPAPLPAAPVAPAPTAPAVMAPAAMAHAPAPTVRAPVHEHAPRPSLPPLADAFAALLAAEQSAPTPADAPAWPASAALPAAVSDDLVEDVTRRVLERLSDRVVRETVSDIVSAIAERLVREEIERIKAAIK
jgi:CheY-like chemotaxis protein